MVFAITHFTVGFVLTLAFLSVVSVTQYRLVGAHIGGSWALVPDIHHITSGRVSSLAASVHYSWYADVFFFHYTLDTPAFRSVQKELTLVSVAILGVAFLVYEWRVGSTYSIRSAPQSTNIDD